MNIDSNERAYLASLASQLREAVGERTGKMERKIIKVAKAIEEVIQ